ncbi:kinase-like protein, partial [Aureobasidium melanogenum]|uniref:Kinase-like protein n=1 Tax=Aureobasidium melanogenum (strain CBS 110374) TaxID=1043003 RepID=A0A074VUQ1_AURM1
MGNTISDLIPTPLPANTIATSYNRNGNYVVQSTLGIGIYGIVYRVTHSQSNRLFAMKVLQTSTSAQLRRFREEATLLTTLSHPNIALLEDIGGVPDTMTGIWNACILTELADYNLLNFYSAYSALGISRLDEALAQTIAHQLLFALTYIHDQGFVHRDLKPANILVFWTSKSSFLFKLADFGLATHFLEDECVPAPVARYTAPELLLQGHDPQQLSKADVWALGMVCRDLCTQALLHPHTETKALGLWATETINWMLREDVTSRPTARECREAVWVRQGDRMPSSLLNALRQDLGLQSSRISDEMEM